MAKIQTGILVNPDQRGHMPTGPGSGHRMHHARAERSHNAQRNYERYLALAQAEAQAGDSVAAENYYQHAEHFFRAMRSDAGAS